MPLKLAGAMTLLKIYVRHVAAGQTVAVVVRELLHNSGRGAEYETARWDDRAFGDDCAGTDDTPSADYGIIEHDRADANKTIVLDFGAMDYSAMADGYPLADCAGNSGVGVQYRAVLDVGVFADGDAVGVGADYCCGPDAGALTQGYLANYNCGVVDIGLRVDCHLGGVGDYGADGGAASRFLRGGRRAASRFLRGGRRGSVLKGEAYS